MSTEKKERKHTSAKSEEEQEQEDSSSSSRPSPEKVVIVETSDSIESEARDTAEAKMIASKRELRGFKGFVKKIWKHNLWHEVYRQKEIAKARQDIEGGENVYAGEGADKEAHSQAMEAIADRFASEYEETIHKEAGEKRELLSDELEFQNEGAGENVKSAIQNLIREYATGRFDEDAFQEEKKRIFNGIKGAQPDIIDKGLMYADNLLEVAQNVKVSVEHGKAIEELDLDFDVVIGKAKTGVRTEAQFSAVDKITDKITRSKVGKFVNETTLASGVAIAYSLGSLFSKRAARSKLLALGSFGATAALAGGVAGLRESKRIEEDRRQHFREMAKSKKYDAEHSPRREEMEEYRYETKGAAEMANALEQMLYVEGSTDIKENLTEKEIIDITIALSEIESRIKLSDTENIDLISYSDAVQVEQERLKLDIVRAEAKVKLKEVVGEKFDESINGFVETDCKRLVEGGEGYEGVEQKNRMFKKMKKKKVAWAATKGLVTGLAIGAVAQEGLAFLRDDQEGLVEGLVKKDLAKSVDGEVHYTPLGMLKSWLSEENPKMGNMVDGPEIGSNTFRLPEGVEFIKNGDTYDLQRGKDILAGGLSLDETTGKLTEEAKEALNEAGIGFSEDTLVPGVAALPVPVKVDSMREFAEQRLAEKTDDFQKIDRAFWYDQDTPAPKFDENELKLWWGGKGNTGINQDGNYVFNVQQMAEDGSYHDEFSVNAKDAIKDGELKVLLSLSKDTQNYAFEVPIDTDGNAIIDKDSEIGKMLFGEEKGKAVFKGKFAEVAQMMEGEEDPEVADKVRLLATHVGKGLEEPPEILTPVPIPEEYMTALNVLAEKKVDLPPLMPLIGRRPLEPMEMGVIETPPYYYGGAASPELQKIFKENRSKTLTENPEADLDPHKEAEAYINSFSPEHHEDVDNLVKQVGDMSAENRLSICIPVAGHQEGGSIYESLKNYTYQTADNDDFEIVLFVNHPTTDKEGNKIKPDKTLKEIERFEKDFPEMNIKTMYSALPLEQAKIGYIRKLLNDAVLVRQHNRGTEAQDLIMVSNDADNKGLAPDYIKNFVTKFDAEPKVDGMLGQLDWDPEAYAKYPLVHVGTRLFQYLSVIGRHRSGNMVSSGANFAFRSSIYAGIGGYITELQGGEDVAVGQAIIAARGEKSRIKFAGARVSRLYTSSRRAITSLESGLAPVEQWSKGFSALDDEVRKFEFDKGEAIDYDDKQVAASLQKDLEQVINRTLDAYEHGENLGKGSKFYKKAVGWLGIKYKLNEKGDLVITDMSGLIKGLKEYQDIGVLMRDAKSGKPEAIKKFKEVRGVALEREQEDTEEMKRNMEADLQKFNEEKELSLEIANPLEKLPDLKASTEKEEIGDYTVARDQEIRDTENGKLTWAYKEGNDEQVFVSKEMDTERMEKIAEMKMLPSDVRDVELHLMEKGFEHPNILTPEERIEKDGKIQRIYEAGSSNLHDYLSEGNQLSQEQAVSILISVCSGVKEMHKIEVIHGDISPDNILFFKDEPKLIDVDGAFIATELQKHFKKKGGWGNRFVMAPEMFGTHSKEVSFGKTVDVYGAATTLYKLISGSYPYNIEKETSGLSPTQKFDKYEELHKSGEINFPPSISPEMQNVIKKAMSVSPSSRYQSMDEFLGALLDVYNNKGSSTVETQEKAQTVEGLGTLDEFASKERVRIELLKEAFEDDYEGEAVAEEKLAELQQIIKGHDISEEAAIALLEDGYRTEDIEQKRHYRDFFMLGIHRRIEDKKENKSYTLDEFEAFMEEKTDAYNTMVEKKEKELKEEWRAKMAA